MQGTSAKGKQVQTEAQTTPGRASISWSRSIVSRIGGWAVTWCMPHIIGTGWKAMVGRRPSRTMRTSTSAHSRPRSAMSTSG